ncbi:MAG: RNA-directed DNA polymerase, partial [Psychroserpens sp.]
LTLNMEKTHNTHINDGFVFFGHRLIRKRGPKGNMRVVTGIPLGKAKAFSHSLSQALSGRNVTPVAKINNDNRNILYDCIAAEG